MIVRLITRTHPARAFCKPAAKIYSSVSQRNSFSTSRIAFGPTATSTPSTGGRTLKASGFAQPREPSSSQPKIQQSPVVPQEDIDDFQATKLINGVTDLKIAITNRASDKLMSIAEDYREPETALRIRVESGGCHGFQYNLDLTTVPKELALDSDLLVFKRTDSDAKVIFDESSLQILQDSKVDYTKELIGSSFKVVDSPYTSTECGCGASFDFDFEKLQKNMEEQGKA